MPAAFSRTFRVRRYECDAYGHVNNTNYVRYLLETTQEATAAAGLDPETCATLGREFRTSMLDIEYLQPVRYGDIVEVETRVTGARGASLYRDFEFRLAGKDEVAARASTVSHFVDCVSGEQAEMPRDLLRALASDEGDPHPPTPEPFPAAPPPPPGVYKLHRHVSWRDLDVSRRVDEAMYLEYMEEASFGVIAHFGWPARRMVAQGFAILMRRHRIEYLQPAVLDDELEIATWASELKRVMATRYYTITRVSDGTVLVRMSTLGVWVNFATGRPTRWPEGFMDDFAANLAEEGK